VLLDIWHFSFGICGNAMTNWNYTDHPSPNFDSREGHIIDMLVLHYTGMNTGAEAIERLCDRASRVSAHYVVDEDGMVLQLVKEDCRAWHAGISSWRGATNINQRSIGIEIVNKGHEFGYHPFPAAQMKMVAMLCRDILAHNRNITPRNVVGHSDVAPARKEDPGELFDWKTLAGLGIGLFPSPLEGEGGAQRRVRGSLKESSFNKIPPHPNPPPQEGRELSAYGYETTDLPKAIAAFQRHFRATKITGIWDDECAGLLAALLAMV
jgi:N-acetylmuramoyl-L-alanine amidase